MKLKFPDPSLAKIYDLHLLLVSNILHLKNNRCHKQLRQKSMVNAKEVLKEVVKNKVFDNHKHKIEVEQLAATNQK